MAATIDAQTRSALVGALRRIAPGSPDVEDAAQVALLRAWEHGDRIEGDGWAWLYTVARHELAALARKRGRCDLPGEIPCEVATDTARLDCRAMLAAIGRAPEAERRQAALLMRGEPRSATRSGYKHRARLRARLAAEVGA